MQNQLKSPLSNVQQELLKLFAADVPDHYLKELKTETEHDDHDIHSNNSKHARFYLTAKKQLLTDKMSKFLLKKMREEADKSWEEKSLSDEVIKSRFEI